MGVDKILHLRELRYSLGELADRLFLYHDELRAAGFSLFLLLEDWIARHCEQNDIEQHRRYLVDYAREVLVSDKPSDIVFADNANCRSSFLRRLKEARFTKYGPIGQLHSDPKTRHLCELSPCLRELARLRELSEQADIDNTNRQLGDFDRKLRAEQSTFGVQIGELKKQFPERYQEVAFQRFAAIHLIDLLQGLGAEMQRTARPEGERESIFIGITADVALLVVPSFVFRDSTDPKGIPCGQYSVYFRLARRAVLGSQKFSKNDEVVVNLMQVFPRAFADYGPFLGEDNLGLNMLAWDRAVKMVLEDAVQLLKKETRGQVLQ